MKKGFTLIELLAVIVVLAIISVIAVPTLIGVVNKARLNSLKSSAYGLVEAGTLYHAQYDNRVNARFDINNNIVTTTETNKIKYRGNIKQGVVIVSVKGQVTVCITDGKNSAYKNYNESEVKLVSGKTCTVPANTSVVYLDGEATIDQVDAKAILDKLTELENKINNSNSGSSNGDLPLLDYTNPLHTFASGALKYTATKPCYVVGSLQASSTGTVTLKVNNNVVYRSIQHSGADGQVSGIVTVMFKINTNDVVEINALQYSVLHVYDVVS